MADPKPKPSLLADIEAASKSGGVRPKVAVILDQLAQDDPEMRAELVVALGNPRFTHNQIARALRARGVQVSAAAVRNYRQSVEAQ